MRHFINCLVLLAVTACANQYRFATSFIVIDDGLNSDVAYPEAAYNRSRNLISFDGGIAARSCREYLKNLSVHSLDETVDNQLVKSEYLSCEALILIEQSRSSQFKPVEASLIGLSLLKHLDVHSFPSSLGAVADEEDHTLDGLFPDEVFVGDYSAGFENGDWHYEVRVVAQGDLNGNEQADWIVWLTDKSKAGNYSGYSTLVVLDPSPEHELIALTFSEYQKKREP